MKVYYDKDAKLDLLRSKRIAVLGYGSQGHAHANNLKAGGFEVVVADLEDSKSWGKAESAGHKVMPVAMAAKEADVIMMALPDELMADVYKQQVGPMLDHGKYLAFAHGFNIHFGQIVPPADVNVFMVAPKGPGHLVRAEYERGRGVPALLAVHQDPSGDTKEIGLAYACGIGAGRAGIIETSFREETETDLFGEQAVLCGGLTALMTAGYEILREAGYSPEMAYFECVHEMKLIVDLVYEGGISNMRYSISNTAQFGDLTRGRRIIDERVREEMRKLLRQIQSGEFAREWVTENRAGKPVFNALTKQGEQHELEETGRELRGMMPWLAKTKLVDRDKN